MKTVLFLCTGNYYRSRFAEEVFNHKAAQTGLGWTATSRALAIERGYANIGAMSPLALQALTERDVRPRGAARVPVQCTAFDLERADLIIALKESEHKPLMLERFPKMERRLEYWHVDDLDVAEPAVALASIDRHVGALLDRLLIEASHD